MVYQQEMKRLVELITSSNTIVAFTGAGISAESGIPTFRGKGGVWEKYDPEKVASIWSFLENPANYWEFARDFEARFFNVEPSPGHLALGELEKIGRLEAVITQNVDGLHQKAGNTRVIELHGNTAVIRCLDCGKEYTREDVFERLEIELPPRCDCGGNKLKPDAVFFGEPLPEKPLSEAMDLARKSDLMLVVGTSLVVYPAAEIPLIARSHGCHLVLINLEQTPVDDIFDIKFYTRASEVLPSVVEEVRGIL
jgi:NAD-dependent deacetylase